MDVNPTNFSEAGMVLSFLIILGGLSFVINAIRGTKPASTVIWGKDESGKTIKARERISWAIMGAGFIFLGIARLIRHH
jgi:hypothetical protein